MCNTRGFRARTRAMGEDPTCVPQSVRHPTRTGIHSNNITTSPATTSGRLYGKPVRRSQASHAQPRGLFSPRTALCTSARIPRLACAASFRKAGSSAQRRASRHRGAERQLSAPASGVRTCMPGSGRRARERASARCARPRGRSTVEEHGRRGRHSQPAGRADSIAWRGGRSPSKPLRGPE